jgi:Phospholipase_D-nuclease N-terminal
VEPILGIGLWTAGITVAGVVALVLGVWAIASVLQNAELSSGAKTGWILVILFLPIFGSIIYFGVRSDW